MFLLAVWRTFFAHPLHHLIPKLYFLITFTAGGRCANGKFVVSIRTMCSICLYLFQCAVVRQISNPIEELIICLCGRCDVLKHVAYVKGISI